MPPQTGGAALLLLVRSEVHGNDVVITPQENIGIPSFSVPNNVHARGFTPWNPSFHTYMVRTSAPAVLRGADGLAALGRALIADATPGRPRPATPQGTRNDVGEIWFGDSGHNFVRSFTSPSPVPARVSDMVINYTIAGEHTIDEGFVLRYARLMPSGVLELVSYGEGNSFKQNPALAIIWLPQVQAVWQQNQRDIIAAALHGRT